MNVTKNIVTKATNSDRNGVIFFFAVLFIFIPLYDHPHLGGTGFRLPFNIVVWFAALLLIFYAANKIFTSKYIELPKYFLFLFIFPATITLSGFISGIFSPVEWVFRLLYVWFGLFFLIGIFQLKLTRLNVENIFIIILLSALIQGTIGLFQFLQPDIHLLWFAKASHGLPAGGFQQINNQATYQVTALVMALYLLTRPITIRMPIKLVVLLTTLIASIVVTLAGSRIGLLTLLISLPLMICVRWKAIVSPKHKRGILIFLLVVLSGTYIGQSGLMNTLDKTIKMSEGLGANARIGIYKISSELVVQSPVSGHGIGSFDEKWQLQKGVFLEQHPKAKVIDKYVTHPHNEILLWAVEGGLLAVTGLFIFYLGLVFIPLRSKKTVKKNGWSSFILLLPILLHTQVELPFYTSSLHWFIFLFLIFTLFRHSSYSRNLNCSSAMLSTLKLTNWIMTVVGAVFLVHTLVSCYELGKPNLSIWSTKHAQHNPYFAKMVETMRYKSLFIESNNAKDLEGVKVFLDWAEKHIKIEPSDQMFYLLTAAFNNTGQRDEMCETIQSGLKIYRSDVRLLEAQKLCK